MLRVARVSIGELELDGLRTSFRVRRNGAGFDGAALDVWGLDADTAGNLADRSTVVELVAGLEGQTGVLVRGTVVPDSMTRDLYAGTTSWQLTEQGSGLRDVMLSASWSGAVRASEVLDYIAGQLLAGRAQATLPRDPTYARGYVLAGRSRVALDSLAADCGCRWSVQAGRLCLLPLSGPARPRIVEWGPDSGLLGVPEQADKGRVRIRVLLAPAALPGDAYRVGGDYMAGDYIAEQVDHDGDTHGDAWETTITGRRR